MTYQTEKNNQTEQLELDKLIALIEALLGGKLESSSRFNEIFDFKTSLSSETDRGCALMIGAYLDELLKDYLSFLFVNDKSASSSFLRADGPLGTFSSRIELCYLLGQISGLVRRELHLLRKIRNAFAHTVSFIDFSHPSISDRIRELKCTGLPEDAASRRRLVRASLFIASDFHAMMWSGRKLDSPADPDVNSMKAVNELLMSELRERVTIINESVGAAG